MPEQRVAFGTSGHRGSSLSTSFNEDHILATTQAIVDYRTAQGITGPLFLGRDTTGCRFRPSAAPSRCWSPTASTCASTRATPGCRRRLSATRSSRTTRRRAADDPGVPTASSSPPRTTRPATAASSTTRRTAARRHRRHRWIADRANELIAAGLEGVKRTRHADIDLDGLGQYDFRDAYVRDLASIIDIEPSRTRACASAPTRWRRIGGVLGAHRRDLRNRPDRGHPEVDPTWKFMTLDGTRRSACDPSSPSAMRRWSPRSESTTSSRATMPMPTAHGIVTPDAGLMNPNHYLAVAIDYLFSHRPHWPADAGRGQDARVVR